MQVEKKDHEVIFNAHAELGTGGWADILADGGTCVPMDGQTDDKS